MGDIIAALWVKNYIWMTFLSQIANYVNPDAYHFNPFIIAVLSALISSFITYQEWKIIKWLKGD